MNPFNFSHLSFSQQQWKIILRISMLEYLPKFPFF